MHTAITLVAALLLGGVGCSKIVGFQDVTLSGSEDGGVDAPKDAPPDAVPDAPPDGPPPKLFVFVTNASFAGGFGSPAGARVTADTKCQDMYNASFPTLGCTAANIHAFIQVDNTLDTLARLDVNYPDIPQTTEVRRATDNTVVINTWDGLVNPNTTLLAPISTSASPIMFWSGRGVASNLQCTNWTSSASSMSGNAGDATKVNGWTAQSNLTCNNFDQRLLCFCW